MHENYKGKRFLFERMRLSLSARDGARISRSLEIKVGIKSDQDRVRNLFEQPLKPVSSSELHEDWEYQFPAGANSGLLARSRHYWPEVKFHKWQLEKPL